MTDTAGTTETCQLPVQRLSPHGVLVTLGGGDGPQPAGPTPVTNSTVAGRPATAIGGEADASCQLIGGVSQVRVFVPLDLTDKFNQIQMTACFAGTDTIAAQSEFDRMITTVSYLAR